MSSVTSREPPVAAPVTAAAGPAARWMFWISYYCLAVIWGIRNVSAGRSSILDFLVPLLLAITLGWWAVADARRRGHPIPLLARPWVYLFAVIAVPVYVVCSRGFGSLGWVILHAVAWYLVATIAMHAAGTIIYGDEWWRSMQ